MQKLSDMWSLVEAIRATPDCTVNPPVGYPSVCNEHCLPQDLETFYRLCGGVTFFQHADFRIQIVSPREILPANPIILIGLDAEQLIKFGEKPHDRPSCHWYIIGKGENFQHISIDFSPEHLGACYDSFWDCHPTNSVIIAKSFTELLTRLLINQGRDIYWDDPGFRL